MQFGIFTVGDIMTDPAIGKAPSEHQYVKNTVEMAALAEQTGLDLFATGEHHNPPFASPSPTTLLANIAARTDKLPLGTATTLIAANNPVRLAEECAYLQHPSDGCADLTMGHGNTGSVYPWFGKDIRKGISLAVENYDLLRCLWRETNVDWGGEFRTALQDFTSMSRLLDGAPPFVWHVSIRLSQIVEQAAYYEDGYLHNNILWPIDHAKKMVDLYRERFIFCGHDRPEQAIVGSGGQIFAARSEVEIIERYAPYLRNTYVHQGALLEEMTQHTPPTVGTPEQIVKKYLTYRDVIGDYQCRAFNLDPSGVPYKGITKQIECLGFEVVPALCVELESTRPEEVPDVSPHPCHRALLEGTEPSAEKSFSLSNEFDPLTGREVRI